MNHSNLCLTPIGVIQVKYLQAEPQPRLSLAQLSPLVHLTVSQCGAPYLVVPLGYTPP